jgi:hypothetical protein
MFQIPAPLPPDLPETTAYVLGGALAVAGAAMLTWGRHIGRFLIMIAAGLAGYFMADLPDVHFLSPIARQMLLILVMLALGFVFERLFWAAIAAGFLATVAAVVKAHLTLGPVDPGRSKQIDQFATFLWLGPAHGHAGEIGKDSWPGLQNIFPASWEAANAYPLAPAIVLGLLILLVAIFRPKWIRIMMVSLIGAAVVTAGLALVVCRMLPAYWSELWARIAWVLAGAGGLAVLGMIAQFVGLARSRPKKADDADKTADRDAGNPSKKREAR